MYIRNFRVHFQIIMNSYLANVKFNGCNLMPLVGNFSKILEIYE